MLSENLDRDHQSMAEALEDLRMLLQKGDLNWAFELLDLFWTQLTVHIRSENVCLFPAILNAQREAFTGENGLPTFEEVKRVIDKLRADHSFFSDQVSQALRSIRELLAQPVTSEVNPESQLAEITRSMLAVEERLREHTELEHQQVYKWPEVLLPPAEYELLKSVMSGEVEKMPRRVERLA